MPQKSPPAFLDYDQTTFDPAYDYAAYPPNSSRGSPPSAAIRRLLTQRLAPGAGALRSGLYLPARLDRPLGEANCPESTSDT